LVRREALGIVRLAEGFLTGLLHSILELGSEVALELLFLLLGLGLARVLLFLFFQEGLGVMNLAFILFNQLIRRLLANLVAGHWARVFLCDKRRFVLVGTFGRLGDSLLVEDLKREIRLRLCLLRLSRLGRHLRLRNRGLRRSCRAIEELEGLGVNAASLSA
jgi:hypothetical protein